MSTITQGAANPLGFLTTITTYDPQFTYRASGGIGAYNTPCETAKFGLSNFIGGNRILEFGKTKKEDLGLLIFSKMVGEGTAAAQH